jgi:hypothetical protein
VQSVTVSGGGFVGQILSAGTGGIGTVSVPKGGFTGSLLASAGGLKSLTLGGSNGNFVGKIEVGGMDGIGTITVQKGGLVGATISATNAGGAWTTGIIELGVSQSDDTGDRCRVSVIQATGRDANSVGQKSKLLQLSTNLRISSSG